MTDEQIRRMYNEATKDTWDPVPFARAIIAASRDAAVMEEQERCAKIVDGCANHSPVVAQIAKLIRARSATE